MQIQISWLLQKPTDLDLHCLQNRVYPGSIMVDNDLEFLFHVLSHMKRYSSVRLYLNILQGLFGSGEEDF